MTDNTTGDSNVAIGTLALFNSTTGASNTAIGLDALWQNRTGYYNTASGVFALGQNSNGYSNTATGGYALVENMSGSNNTATGFEALNANTLGVQNVASGSYALFNNMLGNYNTADGVSALYSNLTGSYNVASGDYALLSNTSGNNNIAIGFGAGQLLTTGHNNIDIGNPGAADETGIIRIGSAGVHTSTYIAGINGVNIGNGVPVYINANGQLGTITSSRRFKKDIRDMGNVSDKLMQLRPVTFQYKQAAENGTHPQQYGLIAEEVAKVYPDLVQYDKDGKPFTIYYHLLTPMLLNELQKTHGRQQAQKAEIATLKTANKAEITALQSEMTALKRQQQQQTAALARLTDMVAASHNKATTQKAVYVSH